ncbi:alanine--tRNA ligase [Candidatus Woesebacteria bacterium]|nr:alanine--tRNA ligase [Candidatus Woesebacteria bacterium]MCD8506726.1 alanine--tRNA ligase [Candidatus Woesebacteria bacterium]MCD8527634.1 alanine--tRNA ligase [Candidatus Woesebacteria bacterium]MCD8546395.1 alanine--tRNA ligase [Candidatus Woesebacteria bacterium]
MITAQELRHKFLSFFELREHAVIPSASLVPDNDPTTLFITAGMHPLVPYLLGQPHPEGTRLVDVQKCIRTVDIDEVGDRTHLTFFEMLGNWSLGDYFKKEAITWSWEFLTAAEYMGLDKEKLFVTVFEGDADAPRDEESATIWLEVLTQAGVSNPEKRIYYYPKSENWWGPAGITGPCGPDTEIFYYTGNGDPFADDFNDEPANDVSDFVEVWNNVFMQFNKTADASYEPLKKNNVDTGLGLERMLAIFNWIQGELPEPDAYQTELFMPVIRILEEISDHTYQSHTRSMRIIADHVRAGIFMVQDGVTPSNKERGYVLRRLIRRAVRELFKLGLDDTQYSAIMARLVNEQCSNPAYVLQYPELDANRESIVSTIVDEVEKFSKALRKGLREIEKYDSLDGQIAFDLYQTYGFPIEMTQEIAEERGEKVNPARFEDEFARHQNLSREQSGQTFKGGLADHSEAATRYHTATHLLHAALRHVLGDHVHQEGSNITAERLRFDFSHDSALTEDQLQQVEAWINEQIEKDWPVYKEVLPKDEALASGALAFFKEKYPDTVSVYTVGEKNNWVSRELCGGPHVEHTGEIGLIEIFKQKSVSAGVRRVYLRFKN